MSIFRGTLYCNQVIGWTTTTPLANLYIYIHIYIYIHEICPIPINDMAIRKHRLTRCGQVTSDILLNTVSGNGLLPNDTKPLTKPIILTHNQRDPLVFIVDIVYLNTQDINPHVSFEIYAFEITAASPRGQWWRHQMETFPRYWPSVRGIHQSPVNPPLKGQWRGALMFSLISAWTNGWVSNRDALRRHRAHYAHHCNDNWNGQNTKMTF